MLEALIFVVFPFCMVFAALSDMVSMTIANRVSLLLVGTFVVIAPLTGMAWAEFGWHLAAGGVVLAATFALFAVGTMGGGDAKLLAATAVWMGMSFELVQYIVFGAMIGGVLTFAILIYRASPISDVTGGFVLLQKFADRRLGVPYGVALGIAGLIVFPQTSLVQWAIARAIS